MRHKIALVLLIALFLIACRAEEGCPEGTAEMEFGCCPDANGDGACDPPQEQEEGIEPEPPRDLIVVTEGNETPGVNATANATEEIAVNDSWSLAERYLATYDRKARSFTYFAPSDYGEVWVLHEPNRTSYVSTERLFRTYNGEVSRSQYSYTRDDKEFENGIEDRALAVMNMIWLKDGKYTGCYVDNVFYREENCILDFPNENPVIWYDLLFNPPESPIDWLRARIGQEPSRVLENRTFQDANGGQWIVDEVTYENQDGTSERLYVATAYGVPLKREIIATDGRSVRRQFTIDEPAFNAPEGPDGRMLPSSRAIE